MEEGDDEKWRKSRRRMEWMEGGSLGNRLMEPGWWPRPHPYKQMRIWLAELLKALDHMHGVWGVVHCDLKPNNLLIRGEQLVIGDFGQASCIGGLFNGSGTPGRMAPEQISRGKITPKADIYSLGKVFEMLLAKCPPPETTDEQKQRALLHGLSLEMCQPWNRVYPGDVTPNDNKMGAVCMGGGEGVRWGSCRLCKGWVCRHTQAIQARA